MPTDVPTVVSAARILDAGADAILRELAAKRGGEGRKITTREEVLQLADDLKSQPTGHLIGNSGARRRPRNIAVQLSSDRDGGEVVAAGQFGMSNHESRTQGEGD
jgi:hypothetical protein